VPFDHQALGNPWQYEMINGAPNFYIDFYSVNSMTFSAEAPSVPEPESWALMISGFGLAGVVLRRRRALVAA
jgi:hypothetical protein